MIATGREAERRAFYAKYFPEFWATVEGYPYALFDVHAVSRETVSALRDAASAAWRIFSRVTPVLAALPEATYADIGIPKRARAIVRRVDARLGASVFARFDFALTAHGPKILEVNAETPFLLWESHEIAGAVAVSRGYEDPNAGAGAAFRAALGAVRAALPPRPGRVVATAMNPYREDWFTACYLARMVGEAWGAPPLDVVATSDLRMRGGVLCDGAGEAIDVLWRMYPLEHFADDPAGAAFCDAIERGRLAIVNPPSSLLVQNKAAQAVIWGLHEARAWFTEDEHADVARYFLPASMEPLAGRHVRKPVLGREGDSVAIVEDDRVLAVAERHAYERQPALHQAFVELPRISYVDPVRGARIGYGVYTAFVVSGQVTALCLRVGEQITDAWAQMLPLGIDPVAPRL